jgi:hypothetical protein
VFTRQLAAAVVFVFVSATACSSGASPEPRATVTVTKTIEPTFDWQGAAAHPGGAAGESPEFPKSLNGWRLDNSWNFTPRAFEDDWTEGTWGDNWTEWNVTMNGCDHRLVLLRWRALVADAEVVSGWVEGETAQQITPGSKGWMVLNGCQVPRWELGADYSDGGNLVDLTVDAEVWTPAP